ncbi:hypothetical protein [Fibrella forsythiae]|uniref:DUF4136 domain-containing protein n=1 Tax=Fibrella forsythiae TaxID=2817061 RepID=A0ABS3JGC9_9BACT|nr:hypothetical protein [Fibrella forsythiae]MBO0949062.1 hypothetical protein [Fibrella forsythiae]
MKKSAILFSITLLGMTSCRPNVTDDANDAGGTASPYLAKQVVGVRMLSSDAPYEKASNLLAEDLVRGTFELGGDTELEVVDEKQGGKFIWGKNEVDVSFATQRPYQSIYHAEYAFDRMYQNKPAAKMTMDADPDMAEKAPQSGPAPEGTGAEQPAESATGTIEKKDASAKNDTASSVSRQTAVAARLVTPAVTTSRFAAYPGLGDKAVWDASTKTMHVLLNNHILNVRVNTSDNVTMARQRAAILANVMLDEVLGSH